MDTTSKVAIMLMLSLLMFNVIKGALHTGIVNRACNIGSYSSNDPYANGMAYILEDMVTVTPSDEDYNYSTTSPYTAAAAYGHATCSQALSYSNCGMCMGSVKSQILAICSNSLGTQVKLEHCRMRYENYSFNGYVVWHQIERTLFEW
ncbi:antifungal protein ginkbilobin-like protein [Eucalyptus grandis]|uniref:antifungal protein ginkbilobin-like protein n=1 Tax=Eucalyptus grandis TaxID=71139 RepID=UPI000524279C|nr:antifungal protein ginkbilobin-like protein [Eucalyptus grandis]